MPCTSLHIIGTCSQLDTSRVTMTCLQLLHLMGSYSFQFDTVTVTAICLLLFCMMGSCSVQLDAVRMTATCLMLLRSGSKLWTTSGERSSDVDRV